MHGGAGAVGGRGEAKEEHENGREEEEEEESSLERSCSVRMTGVCSSRLMPSSQTERRAAVQRDDVVQEL
eukprot:757718-Hanusia_phi.AAC.3